MSSEIQQWISEQSLRILNISDRNMTSYLYLLAEKATSESDLFQKLIVNDFPETDATNLFARELFRRIPRKGKTAQKTAIDCAPVLTNAQIIKQSKKYALVEAEEDERQRRDVQEEEAKKKELKRLRKEERRKHARVSTLNKKDNNGEEESEDETMVLKKGKKLLGEGEEEALDEEELKRRKMDQDLKDRDDFVNRMLEKEEAKVKKKDSKGGGLTADQIQELSTKGSLNFKVDQSAVEQLREISRQHYLEKREDKELKLLEMSMRDEEYLFEGVEVTAEEKKRMEVYKNILAMAKDRYRFNYKNDGYHIPDGYEDENGRVDKAKRESALTARYEEEEQVKTEQEMLEEEMAKNAGIHFGAKDRQEKKDDYDFVFEDQIEFISHEILAGTRKKSDDAKFFTGDSEQDEEAAKDEEERLTEHEKILQLRKRLPVYAYRDEFLEAVRDNKVLIVVGETGSGNGGS